LTVGGLDRRGNYHVQTLRIDVRSDHGLPSALAATGSSLFVAVLGIGLMLASRRRATRLARVR
jgi:hypothetical protein